MGNHRRHKDLHTLFEAWTALAEETPHDLYVTGRDDFGGELQRRSTPERGIVALGDVSTERLASYYAGAAALISPAWREGFGLPMLEAMAMGCPVAASAEAVPGVLAPAAWTFAAGNAAELRATVIELLADEGRRNRFVNVGREIARYAHVGSLRARDRGRLSRGVGVMGPLRFLAIALTVAVAVPVRAAVPPRLGAACDRNRDQR